MYNGRIKRWSGRLCRAGHLRAGPADCSRADFRIRLQMLSRLLSAGAHPRSCRRARTCPGVPSTELGEADVRCRQIKSDSTQAGHEAGAHQKSGSELARDQREHELHTNDDGLRFLTPWSCNICRLWGGYPMGRAIRVSLAAAGVVAFGMLSGGMFAQAPAQAQAGPGCRRRRPTTRRIRTRRSKAASSCPTGRDLGIDQRRRHRQGRQVDLGRRAVRRQHLLGPRPRARCRRSPVS